MELHKKGWIRLPDDKAVRECLSAKLVEYELRMADSRLNPATSSTPYKRRVLEALLNEGSVDTFALAAVLAAVQGKAFNLSNYANACCVINDYCATSGANLNQSSGFRGIDKTEE
ncbi:hypothetical protein J4211_01635 [Candidatus Woesearchaeota archaeon]|nr:hypothetical protein [Candidatus Woesearchaeota archaeon]